jgi:xylonate dehydratase
VAISLSEILDSGDARIYDVPTHTTGAAGSLPVSEEMLLNRPSGDLFGWAQNAAMGWDPKALGGKEYVILSTHGGVRAPDGTPIALGYHTGHWEVTLLVEAAARELKAHGAVPFAGFCTDPCDGRTQGTSGMFDSLAFRNDAASIFRRLIRSLPTRRGVLGVATCDKGVPSMMMALAATREMPCILVPGGVSLLPDEGEDAGKVQSSGARFAHGQLTREEAAYNLCHACASPGGGCQFLGTAATSQVVAEALGMTLPHAALAPSGQPIWLDMASRSARALMAMEARGLAMGGILTSASLRNAMVTHAAFGGSTNLILHLPAIAFAAGLRRPTVDDWSEVNRQIPRLVDSLPNGPRGHATVQVFLAGGVPEVMLHLRRASLLDTGAMTVSGETLGAMLDWWQDSERRFTLRKRLKNLDGIDPDDVIMDPDSARSRGLTSTVTFPKGNLAPGGSVIKSTSIDPSVVGEDGVYRMVGRARVFLTEKAAIKAVKDPGPNGIKPGDVLALICRGPLGSGMEEIFEITAALRYLTFGKHVAVITDARFSGVSTGACIGHMTPEALAGGPIGKLRDGDLIELVIDRVNLRGTVNLVGENGVAASAEEGARILAARTPREDLAPDPALPPETRLWAALQDVCGGTWGGCVFDPEAVAAVLRKGRLDS